MRDLPGFFFDEEKGKYFPIHLKEAYEKEKKALEIEEAKKRREESEKSTDLYKFIGKPPQKYDSLTERINRMQVHEIIWPTKVQIDCEKGLYYQYSWCDDYHVIQHLKLSTGEEVKIFNVLGSSREVVIKFGVAFDTETNDVFHYLILKEDENGEFRRRLLMYNQTNNWSYIWLEPHFPNFDLIYFENQFYFSLDLLLEEGYETDSKILFSMKDMKAVYEETLLDDFDYLTGFPETGLIRVYKGGIIQVRNTKKFTLIDSSAKWIHHYDGKLLILTYHGKLTVLPLKSRKQHDVFDINDFDLPECRFEDLIIDAVDNLVVIGYRNKKELIFINWIGRKVIKKLIHSKPVEHFKIAPDLLDLYIQTLQ